MREAELCEQAIRVRASSGRGVERALGLGEPNQFDFLELMLADQAARVFAGGARFLAKARRVRGVLQRQLRRRRGSRRDASR